LVVNRNTKWHARSNSLWPYGNRQRILFGRLDPSMTYYAALFEGRTRRPDGCAENNKYRRSPKHDRRPRPQKKVLGDRLRLGGWAEYAARTAAHGGSVTISKEQRDSTGQKIPPRGPCRKGRDQADRGIVRRGAAIHYDRIASIEMIEAVGEQFCEPKIFSQRAEPPPAGRARRHSGHHPQGQVCFRIIAAKSTSFSATSFPSGMAALAQILKVARRRVRGPVDPTNDFRASYPISLRLAK